MGKLEVHFRGQIRASSVFGEEGAAGFPNPGKRPPLTTPVRRQAPGHCSTFGTPKTGLLPLRGNDPVSLPGAGLWPTTLGSAGLQYSELLSTLLWLAYEKDFRSQSCLKSWPFMPNIPSHPKRVLFILLWWIVKYFLGLTTRFGARNIPKQVYHWVGWAALLCSIFDILSNPTLFNSKSVPPSFGL